MKSHIFLLALLIVVSCSKTIDPTYKDYSSDLITYDFYGSLSSQTKTSITNDSSVGWIKGDHIKYYSSNLGNVNEHIVTSDGEIAHIPISLPKDDTYLVAVYGCTSVLENKGTGCVLSGVWNGNQNGKFSDSHIAIAKTYNLEDKQLNFHNLVSFIKFSLTRDDVCKIVFSSNNYEPLHPSGKVIVKFNGTEYNMTPYDITGNSITVEGIGKGDFYIATLATTLSEGFTIECYNKENQWVGRVQRKKELVIKDNYVVDLGQLDNKIEDRVNLSEIETSNCYLVQPGRKYKFKPNYKGNSSNPLGEQIKKIGVTWESFCTSDTPKVGDIISNISYDGEYISFDVKSEGNALISVRNIDDDIIWSWHIWSEQDDLLALSQLYGKFTYMDRNLGATSNICTEPTVQGLYYQNGRKDPILPAVEISSSVMASSTISWPKPIYYSGPSSVDEMIKYANNNPASIISNWELESNLWSKEKSEYDPCPVGWKVAEALNFYCDGPLSYSSYETRSYCLFITDKLFFPGVFMSGSSEIYYEYQPGYIRGQYWISAPYWQKYSHTEMRPDYLHFHGYRMDYTYYLDCGTASSTGGTIWDSSSCSTPCHIRCQRCS